MIYRPIKHKNPLVTRITLGVSLLVWLFSHCHIAIFLGLLSFSHLCFAQQIKFDIETESDRAGGDYKSLDIPNNNFYVCVDTCRQDPNCKSFAYVNPGVQGAVAKCWLKSSVPAKTSNSCCISGIKKTVPTGLLIYELWSESNVNLPGGDYKSVVLDIPNPDECRYLCGNDNQCKSYTYVKPGIQGPIARCWLKSSVPSAQVNGCCTSGIKGFGVDLFALGDLNLEPGTNRPGQDYSSLDLNTPDPMVCLNACKNQKQCLAYTYVKPGVQGPKARCWLKSGVPEKQGNVCCVSGKKVRDSGLSSTVLLGDLLRGKASVSNKNCDQSTTADVFNKICDLLPGFKCNYTAQACKNYIRQLYIGNTLSTDTQQQINKWNYVGGNGQLLTEAAMCTLRELSPQVFGPIETGYSGSVGLGDIAVTQKIGFLEFNQGNREFKGYRKLSFCAPVVGCFDSVAQDFIVQPIQFKTNPVATAGERGPLINEFYVINLITETADKRLDILPPAFTIATPAGPVSVQPIFKYHSLDSVVESPFGNSAQTLRINSNDSPGWNTKQVLLKDIYGVDYGVASSTRDQSFLQFGRLSLSALGNRDPSEDKAVWSPPPGNMNYIRPDRDLTTARSKTEKEASTEVKASAKVTYPSAGDAKNFLPDWVNDIPGLDIDFSLYIEPTVRAAFSGQFDILSAEAVVPPGDIGAGGVWTGADLAMKTGVGGTLGFKVLTGLDLKITLDLPVGSKELVNISPDWPIDLGEGPKYSTGDEAYFASKAKPEIAKQPMEYAFFKTFKTNLGFDQNKSAYGYVQACLDKSKQLETQPPPEPTAKPGDPKKLFDPGLVEWPCNVCVYVIDEKTNFKGYGGYLFPVDRPSNAKPWNCDMEQKNGCYDTCHLNPNTGELTFARSPDENLIIDKSKGINGNICYTQIVR